MNPERWDRLKELFQSALEREPGRRSEYLKEACAGDDSLREEVESMIARQPEAGEFLELPALEAQARALAMEIEGEYSQRDPSGETHASGTGSPSSHSARPSWWVYIVAAVFLGDCLLRIYCHVLGPAGFDFVLQSGVEQAVIASVTPGSASDHAGLRAGDILIALDEHTIRRPPHWRRINANFETGRTYLIDIERNGRRLQVAYLMEGIQPLETRNRIIHAIWQIDGFLLLATALFIVFSRPDAFQARMGALALATLSVGLYFTIWPPGYAAHWRSLPLALTALMWIPNVCVYLMGPIVLTFFLIFPRALFRARWPWIIVWTPALCLVPAFLYYASLIVYSPAEAYANILPREINRAGIRLFGLYGLAALAALAANYYRLADANDRRRLRFLLVGGGAGIFPGALRLLIWRYTPLLGIHRWLATGVTDVLVAVLFLLFPASFAYSILRHRLLDIRVMIRLGLRYAFARGAVISLVPLLGVILAIDLLVHGEQPLIEILEMRGWVYAALAGAALLAYTQRSRWGEAIDRRFFRDRYDALQLILEIAGHARQAGDFRRAAPSVVARVEKALHPEFAAIMLRPPGAPSFQTLASAPSGHAPPVLTADSKLIAFLRILGKPMEIVPDQPGRLERQLPPHEIDFLRQTHIELLIPIAMAQEETEALMVLGAKRSEEPYTSEDLDLLAAIAARLALKLEIPAITPARISESFEECPHCGTCYDTGTGTCAQGEISLTLVPLPRSLVGRYRLERRRGSGGMGTVYEATDGALERRVAVKIIREDWVDSIVAAQRFQREARTAAGFSHPNVVTVHDYGVEAGIRAFLVMEFLEGATLREEIKHHARLDAARTVEVFRGVCRAVHAAHRRRLIHRDLKPENIFITRSSEDGDDTVKVLDFGIAKMLTAGESPAGKVSGTETDAGVLIGTLGYISPEQLLGERPSVTWDLWSLAVVAYETLTGTLPFPVANRELWRRSVTAGRYTPLSQHLKDPMPRLHDFFARSLAKEPARRPRSAPDFFRQLEQALA